MSMNSEIIHIIFDHWSNTMKEQGKNPLRESFSPELWYNMYMTPDPRIDQYFDTTDQGELVEKIKQSRNRIAQLEAQLQSEKAHYQVLTSQLINY